MTEKLEEQTEKVLIQHHEASLEYLQSVGTSNPFVRAVFTVFQREECAYSWTGMMEYLAAELAKAYTAATEELVKLKSEAPPSIILPS